MVLSTRNKGNYALVKCVCSPIHVPFPCMCRSVYETSAVCDAMFFSAIWECS
jgi:hypothetical protein